MRQDITAGHAFPDYVLRGRSSTAELHQSLREATREVRRDWDLSDPELERRWDAGDKSLFYPYSSKSMEQMLNEMAGVVDQYAGAA